MSKFRLVLAVVIIFTLGVGLLPAQFGKRLGEAIKRRAEDVVTRKAEDATEKAINKATDPGTYEGDDEEEYEEEEEVAPPPKKKKTTTKKTTKKPAVVEDDDEEYEDDYADYAEEEDDEEEYEAPRSKSKSKQAAKKKATVVEDEEDEDEEFADSNLLVNPSFEDGMDGWTAPDGKWETVTAEGSYKPQHGKYFAWPRKAKRENTYIYQDIPLDGYKAGDSVILSVMVCNYDQPPHDMGRVELQFLDASDTVLKSYTQDQRNPEWNLQNMVAPVPAGAAKARLLLHAIWYVGGDVDAYYDKASLTATSEKLNMVYVTEQDGRETAKKGDVLQLVADNGASKKPSDYEWSSSYNTAATVDAKGVATFLTDAKDGVVFYARDKKSGVVGVYRVNSSIPNVSREADSLGDQLLASGKFTTYGILFDVNKTTIKPESHETLKSIAAMLKGQPSMRVKIVGHTDSDGNDAANLDLSRRRAASVKDELSKTFGIDSSRMETEGAGEGQPVAPNDTPENKAKNRRVEFVKL